MVEGIAVDVRRSGDAEGAVAGILGHAQRRICIGDRRAVARRDRITHRLRRIAGSLRQLHRSVGEFGPAERTRRVEQRCERRHRPAVLEAGTRRLVGRHNLGRILIAGCRRQELVDRRVAASEKLLNDIAFKNNDAAIRERDDDLAVGDFDLRTRKIDGETNDRSRIEIDLDPLACGRRGNDDRQSSVGQSRDLRADFIPFVFAIAGARAFRFRASGIEIRAQRSVGGHNNAGPSCTKFTDHTKMPTKPFWRVPAGA